jgi:hypothetical protein
MFHFQTFFYLSKFFFQTFVSVRKMWLSTNNLFMLIVSFIVILSVAHNYFVEYISKAYQALTDPISRENFEKYGHPDGRQVTYLYLLFL